MVHFVPSNPVWMLYYYPSLLPPKPVSWCCLSIYLSGAPVAGSASWWPGQHSLSLRCDSGEQQQQRWRHATGTIIKPIVEKHVQNQKINKPRICSRESIFYAPKYSPPLEPGPYLPCWRHNLTNTLVTGYHYDNICNLKFPKFRTTSVSPRSRDLGILPYMTRYNKRSISPFLSPNDTSSHWSREGHVTAFVHVIGWFCYGHRNFRKFVLIFLFSKIQKGYLE